MWEGMISMNSADLQKSTKGDSGMEVRKPCIRPGSKSPAPREGKDANANLGNLEVQRTLDSIDGRGRAGLMKQRTVFSTPQALGSHGLADG
jgi:hypothetical protein